MDEKLLLTLPEVMQRTALGRSMLYRLIQTDQLRSVTIGRSRRVLKSDLEDFVRRLGEDAASEAVRE